MRELQPTWAGLSYGEVQKELASFRSQPKYPARDLAGALVMPTDVK